MNQRYSASDFGAGKPIYIETPFFKLNRFHFNSWANYRLSILLQARRLHVSLFCLKISALISHAIAMSCLLPHVYCPQNQGGIPWARAASQKLLVVYYLPLNSKSKLPFAEP